MKLLNKMMLIMFATQLMLAQRTEGQEGQLVIRGGWLFDSVSDIRRPNAGIVRWCGLRSGETIAVRRGQDWSGRTR